MVYDAVILCFYMGYLIYYMTVENSAYAKEAVKKSTFAIDLYHKECLKKFCEDKKELVTLLDFHRIDKNKWKT